MLLAPQAPYGADLLPVGQQRRQRRLAKPALRSPSGFGFGANAAIAGGTRTGQIVARFVF